MKEGFYGRGIVDAILDAQVRENERVNEDVSLQNCTCPRRSPTDTAVCRCPCVCCMDPLTTPWHFKTTWTERG